MPTQSKSVHLYGKPTHSKFKKLDELQKLYKKEVNRFIKLLIKQENLYDVIFDNKNTASKIGSFEKEYRNSKLGSAYSQQAVGQAIKNLSRLFVEIRNSLYGQIITSNKDKYLKFISSRFLFKAAITKQDIQSIIEEFKKIVENNPNVFQKDCFSMLKNTSNARLKDIRDEIYFDFNQELKSRKIPIQQKVTIQLDSRTCTLEQSDDIQAPYIIRVTTLEKYNKVEIPLLTSTNSLRRLNQYKHSKSPQLKLQSDGKVKVSVAFKKKTNAYPYRSEVIGIDIGITDLLFTSDKESFETFSDLDDLYQDTVGQKVENRRNLANKMKKYQKELKRNSISQNRKEYLRKKIYNISRNLQGKNELIRLNNHYHHQIEERISKAVKAIVNKYKDKKITIALEDLDINEFDNSKNSNRKFSSWARGKILSKLKEELAWHGIAYKEVEPAFTSQVCPNCHNLDRDNRDGKSFNCTVCNYKEDADYVASMNIKDRAFNQEIKVIKSQYKYDTDKRHRKLREYFKQKHQSWLEDNPKYQVQEQKQLQLAF